MHAPNPPFKTTVDRKTVAVDRRQLYFRFVIILPPEFKTAKFSTNIGMTPKSNENSEIKKKKNAAKRRNWIEVTGNGLDYMQTLLLLVRRWIRREIGNTGITEKTRITCKVNYNLSDAFAKLFLKTTVDRIPIFLRDSSISILHRIRR